MSCVGYVPFQAFGKLKSPYHYAITHAQRHYYIDVKNCVNVYQYSIDKVNDEHSNISCNS